MKPRVHTLLLASPHMEFGAIQEVRSAGVFSVSVALLSTHVRGQPQELGGCPCVYVAFLRFRSAGDLVLRVPSVFAVVQDSLKFYTALFRRLVTEKKYLYVTPEQHQDKKSHQKERLLAAVKQTLIVKLCDLPLLTLRVRPPPEGVSHRLYAVRKATELERRTKLCGRLFPASTGIPVLFTALHSGGRAYAFMGLAPHPHISRVQASGLPPRCRHREGGTGVAQL